MSSLKLIGLITALMISAALACSAAMLATSLFSGMMAPSAADIATVTIETGALVGLVIWLRSRLHAVHARGR